MVNLWQGKALGLLCQISTVWVRWRRGPGGKTHSFEGTASLPCSVPRRGRAILVHASCCGGGGPCALRRERGLGGGMYEGQTRERFGRGREPLACFRGDRRGGSISGCDHKSGVAWVIARSSKGGRRTGAFALWYGEGVQRLCRKSALRSKSGRRKSPIYRRSIIQLIF